MLSVDCTNGGDDERDLQRVEADAQVTKKSADLCGHKKRPGNGDEGKRVT